MKNKFYIANKIIYLTLFLLITGCLPTTHATSENIINAPAAPAREDNINKQSGYDLLWLSDQYLDIAGVINKKIMEGDTESAKVLLSELSKIVEQISDLNVSPEYEKAKEYLHSATWLDGFSYVMMLEGMPRKDYEETINDGMRQMYLFVQEMNRLGHDIKF